MASVVPDVCSTVQYEKLGNSLHKYIVIADTSIAGVLYV